VVINDSFIFLIILFDFICYFIKKDKIYVYAFEMIYNGSLFSLKLTPLHFFFLNTKFLNIKFTTYTDKLNLLTRTNLHMH